MLKMPASGVLGLLSCHVLLYAPLAKCPAALLDKPFQHPALQLVFCVPHEAMNGF